MANLQKHRTHESLNIETAAEWSVQSRLTISSAAHAYSDVSNISQIGFYSDSDVYVRFDTLTSDTISTSNDLIIPGFLYITQSNGSWRELIWHKTN